MVVPKSVDYLPGHGTCIFNRAFTVVLPSGLKIKVWPNMSACSERHINTVGNYYWGVKGLGIREGATSTSAEEKVPP